MTVIERGKKSIIEGFRRLPPSGTRRLPGAALRRRLLHFHGEVLRMYPVDYAAAPTRGGFAMSGSTADLLQRNVYLHGVWEPHITSWVQTHVRPGDVVVDIGANVGYFSLLSAALVGPGGKVLAFEPVPSIVQQLERNLELNEAAGIVRIHPVIAADAPGEAEIFRGDPGNLGLSATTGGQGRSSEGRVRCVRAADEIEEELWSRIRLVKVDTEGDDLRALRGLRPVLDAMGENAAAVVEVTPSELRERGQTPEELVDEMAAAGFDTMLGVVNHYDDTDYVTSTVMTPRPLTSPPTEKTDVVFLKGGQGAA